MADVKVGDVRRARPSGRGEGGPLTYQTAPFSVVALDARDVCVKMRGRERWMLRSDVERCPLWPSEHEQYRKARGYEVPT